MGERTRQSEAVAKKVGENLVRLRTAAGISQEDLAYMAGMHRNEISQLERGLRVPRVDTLVKLAQSLEAEYAELLAGLSWRAPQPQSGSLEVSSGEG